MSKVEQEGRVRVIAILKVDATVRFATDWMEPEQARRAMGQAWDRMPDWYLHTEKESWHGSNLGLSPLYRLRLEDRAYRKKRWAEHWASGF